MLKSTRSFQSLGLTRVDVLASIVVGIVITAMVTSALLADRTLARTNQSVDHLRQIGEGLLVHADTFGFLPGNGGNSAEVVTTPDIRTINPNDSPYKWGYGDPRRAGRLQPGSWAFAILPYIGHEEDFHRRNQAAVVSIYHIPARRPAVAEVALEVDPIYEGWSCLNDGINPWGKTDFAANDRIISNGFARLKRLDDLSQNDGLSSAILVGEKAMDSRAAGKGGWYWDEPFILGGNGGTGRKGTRLLVDGPIHEEAADNWGSPSPQGVSFVYADGSVHTLSRDTDEKLLAELLSPAKDKQLPVNWLGKEQATASVNDASVNDSVGDAKSDSDVAGAEATRP